LATTRKIKFAAGNTEKEEDMRRLSIVNDNQRDLESSMKFTTIAANSARDDQEADVLVRFLKIQDYLGLYTGENVARPLYTGTGYTLPAGPGQRRANNETYIDWKTRTFTVIRTPK